MSNKTLTFGENAREEILNGINKLADAVSITLGPRGRNVLIHNDFGEYISTKDGVTVAEHVNVKDAVENAGAQLLKSVATSSNNEAGDGTTTATVLARAILKEGFKHVMAGANAMEIKKGIEAACREIVKNLKDQAIDLKDNDAIKNVASISANNDEEIGKIIAAAMEEVGTDGVITVEQNSTRETVLETVEGIQFFGGYLSPYFINKQEIMKVQFEDPYILLYDGRINSIKDIVKPMEYCIAQSKPLLLIAEDIDGEALAGLIVNTARGTLKCCAVKAPGYGQTRTNQLEDIACLTNGTLVQPKKAMKLDKFKSDWFGTCKNITVDKSHTTIVDGHGTPEDITTRIEELKNFIDISDNDYETENYQKRMGKLSGGVAILKIGADSDIEIKEKKYRVEDALSATRAAIDEGIVPGGGIALITASNTIDTDKDIENDDQKIGFDIVLKAVRAPFSTIMSNAGLNADVILNNINQHDDATGYDARTDKYCNLIDTGIIDPAKVTRVALEKATSVAATVLTTDCVITNEDEPEGDGSGPGMMGGGFGLQ